MEKMIKKLYTIAKHYGEPKQKVQAIEEMAELTKAIKTEKTTLKN